MIPPLHRHVRHAVLVQSIFRGEGNGNNCLNRQPRWLTICHMMTYCRITQSADLPYLKLPEDKFAWKTCHKSQVFQVKDSKEDGFPL